MEDVVLVDIAQRISDAREGVVVPVGAAQSTADGDVEALCERK